MVAEVSRERVKRCKHVYLCGIKGAKERRRGVRVIGMLRHLRERCLEFGERIKYADVVSDGIAGNDKSQNIFSCSAVVLGHTGKFIEIDRVIRIQIVCESLKLILGVLQKRFQGDTQVVAIQKRSGE